MYSILKDNHLDAALRENGYVRFPFLEAPQVERLKAFFYENHPERAEGLYATAHHPDFEFRKKMSDQIHEVVSNEIGCYFQGISMLGGTFMQKNKGEKGVLPPHQDWNIVDERNFSSYNIWIPLVDVGANNGSIMVIKGSHRWKAGFRGPNLHGPFAAVTESLWEHMETLEMKAGEALLYDHRLLHSSHINKTKTGRLVVVFGVIPDQAQMKFYYRQNVKVAEYNCHKDFFLGQNPWEGPGGLDMVAEHELDEKQVDPAELNTLINGTRVRGMSIFQKIAELWR